MNDLPLVPSIYLTRLIEFINKEGIALTHILQECGINSAAQLDSYVSINQIKSITYFYLKLTHKTNPGVDFGMSLDTTDHGFLGYVYSFNKNPDELVKNVISYMNVRLPFFSVSTRVHEDYFLARIDSSISDPEVDGFFRAAYITSLYRIASMLIPNIRLNVHNNTVKNTTSVQHLFKNNIVFDCDVDEIYYSIHRETMPKLSTIKQQEEVGIADIPALVLKLRQHLVANYNELTTAKQAASQLGMSERTLRRKLSELGYSFRSIRQETLMRTALKYLLHSNVSIERIAEKCGYSSQASFTRAFQSWQGVTPDIIRKNKNF